MRRRNKALAAAVTLALTAALASPAAPQVASAPLSQVDPWGVGWLAANDGAIPTGFWANTNGDVLAPIFAAIQPKDLSPAARALLSRILLSRSKSPTTGAALVPERLRLMEQLGETAHSADLRKRYADTDWGKPGERLGVELDLAMGKKDACARTAGKPAADRSWMPVRALCAALAGDINATNLITEQVAATDEAFGVWLLSATGSMSAPGAKKPDGRYASAFETAVSIAAKLPVPANALAGAPADVAAAIVLNPNATLEQKRAALRPALDSNLIKSADVLAILTAKDTTPAVKPASTRAASKPDLLAAALAAFATADAKPDARAKAYADALKGAETMADARLAAVALADAIKALPKNDLTSPNAEAFARAALFTGDTKQAGDWRKLMNSLPKESADAWAAARIDLMLSFAGANSEKPGGILDRMVAAAPPPPAAEPGKPAAAPKSTTTDKQLDLRRIENTRALFLYAGVGRDLSPAHRALLATQRTAGRGVSDAAIARIVAAADQSANGEAAMAIISLIGPDSSALSFAGLSDLLAQLRRIGLEKDADALALESLQVWKGL